ncbi:hypothetical protein F5890DRAFT_1560047 [Lentinula detonsa]|uniref:Chromo domain-containing protein n=1 Tax=Lentinula detonsa TaxID=2804962 RepID=A0AA38UMC6_9AGAR|nr:hypothetical protein F5890DRAFT_1560047 [Lentinula detonsa]
MFLLQWKSGDQTWLPYAKIHHLQPLLEYFETLGIEKISQLPPIVNGEEPVEGTRNLFTGSIEFVEYKEDPTSETGLSLNHIEPQPMPITLTAAFFAPNDFPGLRLTWEDRKFEIDQGPDSNPFTITVDEMVTTIQTSLVLGRGWKICVDPRYPEIVQVINHTIPDGCNTYLSYIKDGRLHRSQKFVMYDCFFTPSQLVTLRVEKKLSDNLNKDTATLFPKPLHREAHDRSSESITSMTLANFTKSDMDQSILFAGLMAHARETQRKSLWKLRKDTKIPRAIRGTERYAVSETGSLSTTMGLNTKISKWCLTNTKNDAARKDDDNMDTASAVQEEDPSEEGPSHT